MARDVRVSGECPLLESFVEAIGGLHPEGVKLPWREPPDLVLPWSSLMRPLPGASVREGVRLASYAGAVERGAPPVAEFCETLREVCELARAESARVAPFARGWKGECADYDDALDWLENCLRRPLSGVSVRHVLRCETWRLLNVVGEPVPRTGGVSPELRSFRRRFWEGCEEALGNGTPLANHLESIAWRPLGEALLRMARGRMPESRLASWVCEPRFEPWEERPGELARRLEKVVNILTSALGFSWQLHEARDWPHKVARSCEIPPSDEARERGDAVLHAFEEAWIGAPLLVLLMAGVVEVRPDSTGAPVLCMGEDLFIEKFAERSLGANSVVERGAREGSERGLGKVPREMTLEGACGIWSNILT